MTDDPDPHFDECKFSILSDKEIEVSSNHGKRKWAEEKDYSEQKPMIVRQIPYWTDELVAKLIELIKPHISVILDSKNCNADKKREVWFSIWTQLRVFDNLVTLQQMVKKWSNVVQQCKKYWEALRNGSRTRKKKPEFFEDICEIIGLKVTNLNMRLACNTQKIPDSVQDPLDITNFTKISGINSFILANVEAVIPDSSLTNPQTINNKDTNTMGLVVNKINKGNPIRLVNINNLTDSGHIGAINHASPIRFVNIENMPKSGSIKFVNVHASDNTDPLNRTGVPTLKHSDKTGVTDVESADIDYFNTTRVKNEQTCQKKFDSVDSEHSSESVDNQYISKSGISKDKLCISKGCGGKRKCIYKRQRPPTRTESVEKSVFDLVELNKSTLQIDRKRTKFFENHLTQQLSFEEEFLKAYKERNEAILSNTRVLQEFRDMLKIHLKTILEIDLRTKKIEKLLEDKFR